MDMDEVTTDAGDVIVQVADRELADTVDTALQHIDEGSVSFWSCVIMHS